MKLNRHNKLNNKGFTMAEMLLAVAIVGVLFAVVFVGVINYIRSMAQFERDGIAKEIFIAAQNHLTQAAEQGYLGRTGFGTEEAEQEGVYYFVVNNGDAYADTSAVPVLLLPFGSIDETVRAGGSYIVRYQPDPGIVLDVFYCTPSGTRFGHSLSEGDYASCLAAAEGRKEERRSWGPDSAVLGWYGGADAERLEKGDELEPPVLEVINAEKLQVTVRDPNKDNSKASLVLVITGKTSNESVSLTLDWMEHKDNIEYDSISGVYTVTLDDITTAGLHFSEQFTDLIPGEDIMVQAVAYNNEELTNIAYSATKTTSSLFADPDSSGDARIGNIRHLENLSPGVSAMNYRELEVAKARQVSDLDWESFLEAVGEDASVLLTGSEEGSAEGTFLPVNTKGPLAYDGLKHTISNIIVSTSGDAGLFETVREDSSVSNLMLSGFDITSTGGNAGALAGTAEEASLTNVIVIGKEASVTAAQSAGGLLGSVSGGEIYACASAVLVQSTNSNAGGLAGEAGSSAVITACYSAGHTEEGLYSDTEYNVTAASGTAGGLVGNASGITVTASYSTCSASGNTAGGLIGSASGSAVSNSYAAGAVSANTEGALFGSFTSGSSSDLSYFEIVNERTDEITSQISYLGAVPGGSLTGASAFDADITSYAAFTGEERADALAYDPVLIRNYQGQYSLKTVGQLTSLEDDMYAAIHFGDWPSPEILFINQSS